MVSSKAPPPSCHFLGIHSDAAPVPCRLGGSSVVCIKPPSPKHAFRVEACDVYWSRQELFLSTSGQTFPPQRPVSMRSFQPLVVFCSPSDEIANRSIFAEAAFLSGPGRRASHVLSRPSCGSSALHLVGVRTGWQLLSGI